MASNKSVTSASFVVLLLLFTTVSSTTLAPSSLTTLAPSTSSWVVENDKCPINVLKLAVCARVLLLGPSDPPYEPCCSLISGLVDLEAGLCLCTAIKAKILGIISIDLPVAFSLVLNNCRRKHSYNCA
ncbi:hypothetical protein PIB30_037489 [Stylosanthes scabra]|uniref:Bifunctional inhibitor/plant lipid transfer protein/seed storage helical domain-containing protein n=1 Tax=Stylosanthes scabra TaxID=79078 RepID=A0ABU6WGP1_9FABA|nr:hypothetical protein [Stylosanthes scabra]